MATDITSKWGRPVAERGFAQLPNYLLFINQFLDKEHRLSPVELLVLLQLAGTWWKKGDLPFPSMGTLAVRCGVSDRQIQRAVNQLEKIGLIRRVNRRIKGIISSNAYDLSPLVSILEEIAKAFPNEFPRNVDRGRVREISSRLLDRRVVDAIAEQGSPAYTTPSGAILTLLTQLADEGDLAGFSRAFVNFAHAQPANAAYVADAAAGKIFNAYLMKRLNLDADSFQRWQKSNPNWATSIKAALSDPVRFEHVVDEMVSGVSDSAADSI